MSDLRNFNHKKKTSLLNLSFIKKLCNQPSVMPSKNALFGSHRLPYPFFDITNIAIIRINKENTSLFLIKNASIFFKKPIENGRL